MRKKMVFWTPYGDYYQANAKGEISKEGVNPSGDWLLSGIRHVKRTREFIPFKELFKGNVPNPLNYKSSNNPQWTVEDWDHGTRGTWGNTKYHGIGGMIVTDE